jgi:hypothetical protein
MTSLHSYRKERSLSRGRWQSPRTASKTVVSNDRNILRSVNADPGAPLAARRGGTTAFRASSPICIPEATCGSMSEGSARRATSQVDGYARTCLKRGLYRSRFFALQRITLRQTLLPQSQATATAENIDASEPKIIRSSKVITSFPGQKTQGRRTRLADTAFIQYTGCCGLDSAPLQNTPCIPYSPWSIVCQRAYSARQAGSDRPVPAGITRTGKQSSRRRESVCSNATAEPQKSGGGGGLTSL